MKKEEKLTIALTVNSIIVCDEDFSLIEKVLPESLICIETKYKNGCTILKYKSTWLAISALSYLSEVYNLRIL